MACSPSRAGTIIMPHFPSKNNAFDRYLVEKNNILVNVESGKYTINKYPNLYKHAPLLPAGGGERLKEIKKLFTGRYSSERPGANVRLREWNNTDQQLRSPRVYLSLIHIYRFLIGAFAGMRVSDFSRFSESNIVDGMITMRTRKTDTPIAIPLHPVIKKILGPHGTSFPESKAVGNLNPSV